MSISKCDEYYRLYGDIDGVIISIVAENQRLSFDRLRDELERRGIYMDGRCLRKIVAGLIRSGRIHKIPDQASRKLLLSPPSSD
ncbi:MAG: hypothetical protein QXQ57_02355 [Sulfolobales archaeon]